jgi:adenosine deaminase
VSTGDWRNLSGNAPLSVIERPDATATVPARIKPMGSAPRDLTALPKANLHLHLEGSARLSTIRELGQRAAIPLRDLRKFSSLPEFVQRYLLAVSTVRRPEDLERVCYELLIDEAAQGVRWCEPMVVPQTYEHVWGASLDDVWAVMQRGFDRAAAETGIAWGVIVGHLRTQPVELAERMAAWAAAHAGQGVVGFGIAGDEQLVGPAVFTRAFAMAAEAGLLVVPHAGETVGAASVRGALDVGADRVAHGVRAVEDPALLRRLADDGIACDVCVSSNVRLSVVSDVGAHPLPALLDAGVRVTLGSDDPLFFDSPLAGEYAVVRRAFGLSDDELADIARVAAQVSGAPLDVKEQIDADIDAWLAA